MRRLVYSEGRARFRLVSGGIFIVLGVVITVRVALQTGLSWTGFSAYVLALAMILLGITRFRDFARRKHDVASRPNAATAKHGTVSVKHDTAAPKSFK